MAYVLLDTRLNKDSEPYKYDYEGWCDINGYKESEYTMSDYIAECITDETKAIRGGFNRRCRDILVLSENGENRKCEILRRKNLAEIIDTLKGKEFILSVETELKADVFNNDGSVTNITYRFVKDEDSMVFKRVVRKFESGEKNSAADISRCSESIRPLVKEIFEI